MQTASATSVSEAPVASSSSCVTEVADRDVVYHLRDINFELYKAWKEAFTQYGDNFKISSGDIFCDAPAADAIVSPANSFGFMTAGIDLAYSKHFGDQLQQRIQELIRTKHNGELLVGQAAILPAYPSGSQSKEKKKGRDLSKHNQGQSIKYLISAPTMRVSMDISKTTNVFLCFRGIILAVQEHNATPGNDPIRNVLVPGLGTAKGRMHVSQCAWQMLQAYETYVMRKHTIRLKPTSLSVMINDSKEMTAWGGGSARQRKVARPSNPNPNTTNSRRKPRLDIGAYFSH